MKPKYKLKGITDNLSNNHGLLWDVLVGAGCALLAALVYVALYAAVIKLFHMKDTSMPVVNEVAKVLCILLGSWISVRKRPEKGWLRGGLTGIVLMALVFVLFSAIMGDWTVNWATLSDLLMGAVVGGIGGILCVNLRRKRKG